MAGIYEHGPIEFTTHIRLFLLFPSNEELTGEIISTPLIRLPSYEALSYVWESDEKTHTVEILDSNPSRPQSVTRDLPISKSLHLALCDLKPTHLGASPRILWVDAVCIDQQNDQEKSSQVQLMPRIYRDAFRVIAYIDSLPRDVDEGLNLAMRIVDGAGLMSGLHLGTIEPPGPRWSNQLPPPDDRAWDSLRRLVATRWSKRIWIISEFVVNDNLVMQCGSREFDWLLLPVICLLFHQNQINMPPLTFGGRTSEDGDIDSVLSLGNLRAHAVSLRHGKGFLSGDLSTQSILIRGRFTYCKDPRDHVFALHSLGFDAPSMSIEVDYSKSVEEVFTDCAIALMQRGALGLSMLTSSGGTRNLKTLPSWVPDWTAFVTMNIGGFYPHFRATPRSSYTTPRVSGNKKRLIVKGCLVDRIARVFAGPRHGENWGHQDFLNFVHVLYEHCKSLRKQSSVDIITDFAKALVWNTDLSGHEMDDSCVDELQQLLTCASTDLDAVESTASAQQILLVSGYGLAVRCALTDRVFVFSDSGYIGMANPLSRPGDHITLVLGAHLLYILPEKKHPTTTSQMDRNFQLIGNCYLHGLTRSEAFDEHDCLKEKFHAEELTLE